MANTLLNALKYDDAFTLTENGGVTLTTTHDGIMDLFALGAAYRSRSTEDCVNLFNKALAEDELYALKCLFYIRDVRGGKLVA